MSNTNNCRIFQMSDAPILVSGTSITFNVFPLALSNGCTYRLPLCATWDGATGTEVVMINDGENIYTVRNNYCNGNNDLRLGFLRQQKCGSRPMFINMVYGSDTPHFTVCHELPKQCLNITSA